SDPVPSPGFARLGRELPSDSLEERQKGVAITISETSASYALRRLSPDCTAITRNVATPPSHSIDICGVHNRGWMRPNAAGEACGSSPIVEAPPGAKPDHRFSFVTERDNGIGLSGAFRV